MTVRVLAGSPIEDPALRRLIERDEDLLQTQVRAGEQRVTVQMQVFDRRVEIIEECLWDGLSRAYAARQVGLKPTWIDFIQVWEVAKDRYDRQKAKLASH